MKIEFMTHAMIEDCLLNSKVFRDAVINELFGDKLNPVHDEVRKVMCKTFGLTNKIAFIKGIREISEGRVMDFVKAFPLIVTTFGYDEKTRTLSLSDSKKLAESYCEKYPSYEY